MVVVVVVVVNDDDDDDDDDVLLLFTVNGIWNLFLFRSCRNGFHLATGCYKRTYDIDIFRLF